MTNAKIKKIEKKLKKCEREKKNLKEMIRLSPEGIVCFSLTLSDPFHGTKKNL